MSETYVPRPGDRVRFYSWAAQMDLYGEVLTVAPQARLATVREDTEDGHTCVKSWDVLRLDQEAPVVPSFWEAAKTFCRTARVSCDLANNQEREIRSLKERQQSIAVERNRWASQAGENAARARIAEKRAERAEADLTQCRKALHDAITEAAEVEKDRDGWVQEAKDNEYISRIGYDERDKARARVKELEAELARFHGVLVPRHELDAAEARVEELEDQNRVLKSDLDHARAAGEVLQRVVERHRAETWTDHDGTVRNLGGITRAELAQKLYDENERAGRAVSELVELKKALFTLAATDNVGTELP